MSSPNRSSIDPMINELRKNPCSGNIFNHYNVGGYLIWKYPEQKVYIDGRMPSWQYKGTKYMDNYLRVLSDPSFQKSEFQKYNITCAIMPKDSDLAHSLTAAGWSAYTPPQNDWVLLRLKK